MKKIVPVFPWPMHPKVAEQLATIPDIRPVEALPGGPGPVLAIRQAPTFVADVILVMKPERVLDAVHIITADGIELMTLRETLTVAMKGDRQHPFQEQLEKKGPNFQ